MKALVIFISLISILSANAANIKDSRVWSQDTIFFSFPENMPFKAESEAAILNGSEAIPIPMQRKDEFQGDIYVTYIENYDKLDGARPSYQGNRIVGCEVKVGDTFKNDPVAFSANLVHEIRGHCGCLLNHTSQFVFEDRPKLELGVFQQPLMAGGGRIIRNEFSFDDKNGCWENYGRNIKNRVDLKLISAIEFDNIFLINDADKKYSLSKFGNVDVTNFYNLYPGQYKILVRLPGSLESKFLCRTEKGYKVCSKPELIWIETNKTIRVYD